MICVKKEGRVCTVYLDGGSRPMHFNDFNAPPPGFPFTASEDQIRAKYPGEQIQFIEEHRPAPPVSVGIDERQIAALMGETSQASPAPVSKLRPNAPPSPSKAEEAFADMLRRLKYAKGKEFKQLKSDVEAVATFLIDANILSEEQLIEVKERELSERKRFSL